MHIIINRHWQHGQRHYPGRKSDRIVMAHPKGEVSEPVEGLDLEIETTPRDKSDRNVNWYIGLYLLALIFAASLGGIIFAFAYTMILGLIVV